jgi:hypothetical protein
MNKPATIDSKVHKFTYWLKVAPSIAIVFVAIGLVMGFLAYSRLLNQLDTANSSIAGLKQQEAKISNDLIQLKKTSAPMTGPAQPAYSLAVQRSSRVALCPDVPTQYGCPNNHVLDHLYVTVSVKNISQVNEAISPGSFTLVNNDSHVFTPTDVDQTLLPLSNSTLYPGKTSSGVLGFLIPANAADYTLTLGSQEVRFSVK